MRGGSGAGARTAALLDLCGVLLFVAIGRASHHEGGAVAGPLRTVWPFLCGLAVGWAVARAWLRPRAVVPTGVVVWPATVAVGMALRAASGQGVAVSFVLVALAFLGLLLLGWRAVAYWRQRVRGGGPQRTGG